mmetsp:Transcript_41258/g.80734  ORF Transcript_41258/g.80734 Transcript_41258/m.80734 type:complete len:314 (+) Transcript_41258:133-1074(+)
MFSSNLDLKIMAPYSSSLSRMSMYSFLMIPNFSSPNLSGASMAMMMGNSTPIGDPFTQNMAPKQAICTDVKRLVIFFGTAVFHGDSGASLLSVNRSLVRSHISFPGSAEIPRYMKRPINTLSGTCARRFRGPLKKIDAPMKECMVRPVMRCSWVFSTVPSGFSTLSALTCEMDRTVAATSHGSPTTDVAAVRSDTMNRSACMPSRRDPLRRPLIILYRGLLTRRTVMFWSRKSRTVAMSAGMRHPKRAQTGMVLRGMSHGRPEVVAKVAGTARVGRVAIAPCERRAARAMSAPPTTPMVGAKLEMLLRSVLLR